MWLRRDGGDRTGLAPFGVGVCERLFFVAVHNFLISFGVTYMIFSVQNSLKPLVDQTWTARNLTWKCAEKIDFIVITQISHLTIDSGRSVWFRVSCCKPHVGYLRGEISRSFLELALWQRHCLAAWNEECAPNTLLFLLPLSDVANPPYSHCANLVVRLARTLRSPFRGECLEKIKLAHCQWNKNMHVLLLIILFECLPSVTGICCWPVMNLSPARVAPLHFTHLYPFQNVLIYNLQCFSVQRADC